MARKQVTNPKLNGAKTTRKAKSNPSPSQMRGDPRLVTYTDSPREKALVAYLWIYSWTHEQAAGDASVPGNGSTSSLAHVMFAAKSHLTELRTQLVGLDKAGAAEFTKDCITWCSDVFARHGGFTPTKPTVNIEEWHQVNGFDGINALQKSLDVLFPERPGVELSTAIQEFRVAATDAIRAAERQYSTKKVPTRANASEQKRKQSIENNHFAELDIVKSLASKVRSIAWKPRTELFGQTSETWRASMEQAVAECDSLVASAFIFNKRSDDCLSLDSRKLLQGAFDRLLRYARQAEYSEDLLRPRPEVARERESGTALSSWPTFADLRRVCPISDDTFRRILKDAGIKVSKKGGGAKKRRFSPDEINEIIAAAIREQRLDCYVMSDKWAKWGNQSRNEAAQPH